MTKKISKRKLIFFALITIFFVYIFFNYTEIIAVVDAFSQGSWRWLILAAITQVIYYLVYTLMTQKAFETVGIKRRVRDLYPLVLGSLFVNTLAPTAGNSGTILFADDASRRNESSTKAIVGYLVSTVASYSSFFTLLIFAIWFLASNNLLNTYEIIGATIFVFPTILPPLLLVMATKKTRGTINFLNWIRSGFNFITRHLKINKKIDDDWATEVTKELQEAAEVLKGHGSKIAQTMMIALTAHGINIASLYVIFVAFDIHIHYGALIAGYVFAEVVRVISPNPEGVGAVEAVIVLILGSFGVPLFSATAIAITFRGLNFWAPLGLGFVYLQRLKSFK